MSQSWGYPLVLRCEDHTFGLELSVAGADHGKKSGHRGTGNFSLQPAGYFLKECFSFLPSNATFQPIIDKPVGWVWHFKANLMIQLTNPTPFDRK